MIMVGKIGIRAMGSDRVLTKSCFVQETGSHFAPPLPHGFEETLLLSRNRDDSAATIALPILPGGRRGTPVTARRREVVTDVRF